MRIIFKIFEALSSRGKSIWIISVFLGIIASILEVASAATFSLLTSSFFGGRTSNLGILDKTLPFSITQAMLISVLGAIFIGKLGFQWVELNLKTRAAEEFFDHIFLKRASLSQYEISKSDSPVTNLANRMHILTHNIYYPSGLIVSELLILIFLIPFVIYISPWASLLVFGATLLLSIPILSLVRKKVTSLNKERMAVDEIIDYVIYSEFRTFYDQGHFPRGSNKLKHQIHEVSEIDRRIVKLGSYSRFTIELSFIISVILTFSLMDRLVEPDSRIQFFAVLAYSFFRVIPAFSRIIVARNQIASHQAEFLSLMNVHVVPVWDRDLQTHTSFAKKLKFNFPNGELKNAGSEIIFSVGDFVAVKGDTGAGKTTFLKTIGGLISSEFELEIDGHQSIDAFEWRPLVSLVSQNPFLSRGSLMEMITGEENANEVDHPLYKESVQISGLSDWLQNRRNMISNELVSGGERKQIALARAIYLKPEILLLDEITAGMDSELAENILHNLRSCSKFKLILFATHDSILEAEFSQIIQL